ncbi:hypothetical protein B0H13DRAFT_1850450 [Mycena leptocephala]|nr:hypothetical protein B0H13DRAFT_1850450 [Mycena leptocephala]
MDTDDQNINGNDADHPNARDFVYIDSKETLNEFSAFIDRLGETKIQNWWRHKKMHEWIIPCLVKSQSPIPADVWDSTPSMTNTNEAQHAWTNARTGIKLTVVEGLETRYEADKEEASEHPTKRAKASKACSDTHKILSIP